MAEISMKKVALSGILICPMELTNRKKSGMLVNKTENEGCLRNKKILRRICNDRITGENQKGKLEKVFRNVSGSVCMLDNRSCEWGVCTGC